MKNRELIRKLKFFSRPVQVFLILRFRIYIHCVYLSLCIHNCYEHQQLVKIRVID